MLERFKRTGSDRSPSGAVATSERARDDETRTADDTEELNEPGATRAGAATRPTGPTGAADDDADTAAEDPLASEREARRRERESRRAGRAPRQDSGAAATMAGEDTTGTAMRDDDTAGTAMRDDDAAGTAMRDDDTTRTAVHEDGEGGRDRTAARAGGAAGGATASVDGTSERTVTRGALTGEALKTARARQRDEFGGLNWGSSFFGWLVAVGIAALITGLLAAMGAAIGLTTQDANVDSLGLGGGIALLAALMLAYFCGGYVAGRMSRFDGARQGAGVWVIAFVVTVALALLAIIAGDKYNVVAQLGLPSIPVGSSELRSGGWIALLAVVVGTFLAAVVGGKSGERFHRRVDRAAFID